MCSIFKQNLSFLRILTIILTLFKVSEAINITLGPGTKRFLTINAVAGDVIIGSVGVVPSDTPVSIDLYRVESQIAIPNDHKPIPNIDFSNINYFVAETGYYSLSLANTHSGSVTVVVSIRAESDESKGYSKLSTVDDLKDVVSFAEKLLVNTRSIMNRMEAYSTREFLLSKIINDMNSRIITFSFIQMFFVIGLCCAQIYYISSFFEVKSFV
ncbi:COPII-coated vesicle membrane protein, putative [Theileria equi strain WA]|uniref:COPII-coated vesicle membrane protein, putative n=1 Tax=Theileria equi strain WA TaxID=1537102 RepID=L1LGY1_THEEQ|nr:COPII-coated vesicle membrane protein, putative [Theileria equi strain WA]EKX74383.1 COPII-coated vesicle membrane protein, putative [Theileria equi strain WA]|eukprot:XP_004833835.1 COPII-coated vesicle membrane protein, putative [Theileria equi strain WA]